MRRKEIVFVVTSVVVGDLRCGLKDSCHQGRRRGNKRMWLCGYMMDGVSEGLGEREEDRRHMWNGSCVGEYMA